MLGKLEQSSEVFHVQAQEYQELGRSRTQFR